MKAIEGETALVSIKDLIGKKVWIERPKKNDPDAMKKMGRVRACVFHPNEKRCVGFLVKRPDVALMFHRQDMFVGIGGYDIVDGFVQIREDPDAVGKAACKRLHVSLDDCVLWLGLPAMCEDGTSLGIVDNIWFSEETGAVHSIEVSQGATANTLLGRRRIPVSEICGFHRGMGTRLYMSDDDDDHALGALLVSESAKNEEVVGGVAEKAGAATAVAGHQVKKVVKKVKPKAEEAASAAASVAGEAIDKAVYATGRQIGRTKGMFGNFKDEFKKAMHDDE